MAATEPFPGKSVIGWYDSAERMLEQVLGVVPYCEEHEGVWSPALVTVLLETCSQLDSLWAFEARQSAYVPDRQLEITDYFNYFGEYVGYRWVVFYGETAEKIEPFGSWASGPDYRRSSYVPLDWRKAYNSLKHDRLSNRREATLRRAVHALAGLFLAILRCEYARDEISQAGWLSSKSHRPEASLGEDSLSIPALFIAAESRLFSYPVGWCKESIAASEEWCGPASHRFRRWFDKYEQPGRKDRRQ